MVLVVERVSRKPCTARKLGYDDAMRGLSLLLAIGLGTAPSLAAEPPLLVPAGDVAPESLEAEAARRGLEVAHPQREPDVAAEAALAEARPLYRDMAFGRAVTALIAAEQALIDGKLPGARLATALAEIEIWIGACQLVDNKAQEAHDRFALARALDATARPDRIFPPEVAAAFAHAGPGARVTPRLALSPPGARLWLDGQLAGATATVGLHWIVVERADRRPVARIGRITQAAPEIAVSLADNAAPADALRQAAARALQGPLGSDEGLGVSAALARTLWIVGAHDADRFAAGDIAQPTRHLAINGAPIPAVCAVEPACIPLPQPRRPIYRRAALWVPLAGGLVLAIGAGVLAGTLANSSSDYVARVR
jgi:hypothetical protein